MDSIYLCLAKALLYRLENQQKREEKKKKQFGCGHHYWNQWIGVFPCSFLSLFSFPHSCIHFRLFSGLIRYIRHSFLNNLSYLSCAVMSVKCHWGNDDYLKRWCDSNDPNKSTSISIWADVGGLMMLDYCECRRSHGTTCKTSMSHTNDCFEINHNWNVWMYFFSSWRRKFAVSEIGNYNK